MAARFSFVHAAWTHWSRVEVLKMLQRARVFGLFVSIICLAPLALTGCSSEGDGDDGKALELPDANAGTSGGPDFETAGTSDGLSSSSSGGDGAGSSTSSSGGDTGSSGASSSSGADAVAQPGEFGYPCTENKECDSSICVPTPNGKICTKICTLDCPEGYRCVAHKIGSDLTNICAPKFPDLCNPCKENKDCNSYGGIGNVCLSFGANGSFCGVECGPDKAICPKGYTCQKFVDPDSGKSTQQCMVEKGKECSCSKLAVSQSLATNCVKKNNLGSCPGERKCASDGLSKCLANDPKPEDCNGIDDDCNGKTDDIDVTSKCKGEKTKWGQCEGKYVSCTDGKPVCDAPKAGPEKCNGLDDNCDGKTDEGLCDDGIPCTRDFCNTDGSCKNDIKLANGQPCEDGKKCTKTDKCQSGKCVGGNVLGCDDKDPCTKDSCDDLKGCIHTPVGGPCKDDGIACTQDLCKGGKCTHPPTADGGQCLDDGQACTKDECQSGKCIHTPLKETIVCKEDGNSCTADICKDGKCAHLALDSKHECLDDGNKCTSDVCKSGKCTHTPKGNGDKCLDDGNPCTVDVCNNGKCAHKPAVGVNCADDSDPCTNDVCENGKCAHKPASGMPCADDGHPCTQDKCVAGKCKHPYNSATCDDKDPCTLNEYCNLGKCKSNTKKKCDDANKCTSDYCAAGQGCVHKGDVNLFCNDGNSCTTNDQCQAGKCIGKSKKQCNDNNPCTTDGCDNNGCKYTANSANCKDDGNPCTSDICANKVCSHKALPNGASCKDDGNPCTDGKCKGGACGQVANGKVCNDGDACTSNDKCTGGKCTGQKFKSCEDGNPCTKDFCDIKGKCQHSPLSTGTCTKGGECPLGICAGGKCVSKPDVTCQAKFKADLCKTQYVAGKCTAAGKCVVKSPPSGFQCPGCKGLCVKCTIFGGIQLKYCLSF